MPFTAGIRGFGDYGISDKKLNYGGVMEISSGNSNGKGPFVGEVGVGVGAINGGIGCGTARLKLGGEIPFTKTGCQNWFTTSGLTIYGEGKLRGNFTPTENTGTAKDNQYEYKVDGGGGVEVSYRTAYFDGAIGVKGGYKSENIFSTDKDLRAKVGVGQAYVGPTLRFQGFIPHTGRRGDIYSGLSLGGSFGYDALHNQLEAGVSIAYTI